MLQFVTYWDGWALMKFAKYVEVFWGNTQEMINLNFKQGPLESVICKDSKPVQRGCFQQSSNNMGSYSSNGHQTQPRSHISKLLLKKKSRHTKEQSLLAGAIRWAPKGSSLHNFIDSLEKTMSNLGYWNDFPTGWQTRQKNKKNTKKLMRWPTPRLLPSCFWNTNPICKLSVKYHCQKT